MHSCFKYFKSRSCPQWSISRSIMSNETTPSVFLSGLVPQMANTMGYIGTFLFLCILFVKLCIDCIYLSFSLMIVVIVLISWLYHNLGQTTMFHKWLSVTWSQEALSIHHSHRIGQKVHCWGHAFTGPNLISVPIDVLALSAIKSHRADYVNQLNFPADYILIFHCITVVNGWLVMQLTTHPCTGAYRMPLRIIVFIMLNKRFRDLYADNFQ